MGRDQRRSDAGRGPPASTSATAAAALFQGAARDFEMGRFAGAERGCRQILAAFPNNASALHLLGLVAFRTHHLADARALIERSLAQDPNAPDARNSLGCVMIELKEPAQAVAAFDAALKLRPVHPDALANRARALLVLGRPAEAVDSAHQALAAKPDHFDAWTHLGNGFFELGQLQAATDAFARAAALRPDHAGAHNNLGRAASEQGRFQQAEAEFRRAIELAPRDPTGYINLGATLIRMRLPAQAEAVFRQARQWVPTDLGVLIGLGEAQLQQGRIDAALEAYGAALAHHPDDPEAYWNLGSAYISAGRRGEAIDALNAALRLNPDAPAALASLVDLRDPEPGDLLCEHVERLLESGKLDEAGACHLRFAMGRVHLKAKDGDRAFAHLSRANRLKRARIDFDIEGSERFMAKIATYFTPEQFARLSRAGTPSDRPIFVVGMPRSGTTLVEQILASHPNIWGGDELGTMGNLARGFPAPGYPEAMVGIDPGLIADIGRDYLAQTDALAQGRARLVDKMPVNFVFAGLIALALPGARIISCRRDPVDTCLSCYSNLFGNVPYSYDLVELGRYWRAYDTLMAHWRVVLPPDRFLDVRYEDMVVDIASQARRLVAFAGLPWDEACLAFHTSTRLVRTSSANQVRQPIYNRSVGRGMFFADHLGPLLKALDIPNPSIRS